MFGHLASATARALTRRKDAPSLYDLCDPLLTGHTLGDPHLSRFYKTALANLPMRLMLRGAGLPELDDTEHFRQLREALTRARDDATPDWDAIGRPVAALVNTAPRRHPSPRPIAQPVQLPQAETIDAVIRRCGAHLLASYRRNGFIPTYAAFNLTGDPDTGGRELIMALTGLQARGYKNSTLMFGLARPFIVRSPANDVFNPPWTGIAEPMWSPVQIRHRSAYYDAFFIEALLTYQQCGLARAEETGKVRGAIADMVDFCINISREAVLRRDGSTANVITALAPAPHPRFSRFFTEIKERLGFGIYVPDCDTTACSISAATQAGASDPILDQPLLDFYADYQVGERSNAPMVTVPLNDNIDYDGGIVTWIENIAGERPYGNDLDPTLNLDVLEVSFRNCARWHVVETPSRLETVRRIIAFQRRLVESGAFANPRSHIYYLPELYCAYFGRCYAAFRALPQETQNAIDPDDAFATMRKHVLNYVRDELIRHEMNAFDAALALIALGHLGADRMDYAAPLRVVIASMNEGGGGAPYRAYEWNKMKTPTRIVVGGPEVTSAFVLMGLVLARQALSAMSR